MNLREKLGRLGPLRPLSPLPSKTPTLSTAPAVGHASPLRSALAEPVHTPHGPLYVAHRWHAADHLQGTVRVAEAAYASPATLASLALDPSLAEVDPSRMLLLDTETTGLHGGSGTLPFLVGLAWFEDHALVVRQAFLRRPGEEGPLLRLLAERMEASSVMVTYNGKCFDWPLLRTRFVMNRLPPPTVRPHLDLLHCCRRVFKRRLGGVRLGDLEQSVLGHRRVDDIEGEHIPEAYFDFLRRGDPQRMEQVLEHNLQDLVSLAAMVAALSRRYEQVLPHDDPRDCLALASIAYRAGERGRATRLAEEAVERANERELAAEGLAFLAAAACREGEYLRASQLLHRLTELAGVSPLAQARAHLGLAKIYEHKLKSLPSALRHAQLAQLSEAPSHHERRVARLSRRVQARATLSPEP